MKNQIFKTLLFSLFIFSIQHSSAQITVYGSDACYGIKLSDNNFEQLKKSTVYFVVPKYLIEDEVAFSEVIKKSWKYSKIEIIDETKFDNYLGHENAAFLSLGYSLFNGRISETYYELWKFKNSEKGFGFNDNNKLVFGSFNIEYECDIRHKLAVAKSNQVNEILQQKNKIVNFKPYIIANYLKIMSKSFSSQVSICAPHNVAQDALLDLSRDTLYITTNFLYKVNYFEDCEIEKLEETDLMSKYPFNYKFITMDELNKKLNSKKKFYYYIFLEESSNLDVYSNMGELIFRSDVFQPPNRKLQMKQLIKAINKKTK